MDMTVEQRIMCAVVRVDMFLMDCWIWLLVILVLLGLSVLACMYASRH